MRARPSAEIRVVEVQKLGTFYDFCGPRATLCGDSRGRGSKTEDFLRFLRSARDPLRRSCASKRSRCGAVRIVFVSANPLRRLCVSKRSRCGAVKLLAKRPLRSCLATMGYITPEITGKLPGSETTDDFGLHAAVSGVTGCC